MRSTACVPSMAEQRACTSVCPAIPSLRRYINRHQRTRSESPAYQARHDQVLAAQVRLFRDRLACVSAQTNPAKVRHSLHMGLSLSCARSDRENAFGYPQSQPAYEVSRSRHCRWRQLQDACAPGFAPSRSSSWIQLHAGRVKFRRIHPVAGHKLHCLQLRRQIHRLR